MLISITSKTGMSEIGKRLTVSTHRICTSTTKTMSTFNSYPSHISL